MSIACNGMKNSQSLLSDLQNDWSIVENRSKCNFLLIFIVKDSISLAEFIIACSDVGLNWLISRAYIHRFGDHIRISIRNGFVRLFTPEYVSRLSRLMHVKYGCRCVCDEMTVGAYTCNVNKKCADINLVNRYNFLQHEGNGKSDEVPESVGPICEVGQSSKNVAKTNQRGLRIGMSNFQGVCSGGSKN